MRALRLLHTSDVHLGGGFHPPSDGEHLDGCLCPLVALESMAAHHAVDAVLVVGDLFDHQRVSDEFVTSVLDRLGSLGAECLVINGNHDVHDDGTLYRREVVGGAGVTFFDDPGGSLVEIAGGAARAWAKAMPIHDRSFRPLQDIPARPEDEAWWLVLGHGHFEDEPDDRFGRSSPINAAEIAASGADYIALGHWHVRTDVSSEGVTAWYSGAPYGFASSGTMNLIELDPAAGVRVTPVETALPASGCAPYAAGVR
ncbi:MAG: metallophosphoesterase [Actinomycetota bacterium]